MGSVGFLLDLESYMIVFRVGRGPIGLVAPSRFKFLDSQPVVWDMGPVPIDFHDFLLFRKVVKTSCFEWGCDQGHPKVWSWRVPGFHGF